jgi:hypothetical protein
VVAEQEGEAVVSRVAVRGRNRRTIVCFGRVGFVCEKCGHLWEHHQGEPAGERERVGAR